MQIKVLGSSAGGGLPQWNCNGRNSRDVRRGVPGLQARTQSSLAVSADGRNWVLLNASPDLRAQIAATPEIQPDPEGPARNSPIEAVVLTNGDVDHVAGLLNLREGEPFNIYATDRVLGILAENTIFNVLNPEIVARNRIALDRPTPLAGPQGDLGLVAEPFAVPGKIALYLEDEQAGDNFGTQAEDTIGLKITESASGAHFFYIPGCARMDEQLASRLKGAPLVFFDGTLFTDNEMIEQGLLPKTGTRMGHMNMSGPDGSIAAFEPLGVQRRVYIHINNSNPALREDSPERRLVEDAGWEIAWDGMEIRI